MSGAQSPSTSFSQKQIDVTFQRKTGTFAQGGGNQVTVSGLRVSARIVHAGGISQGELDLRIWGLSPSLMADLALVGAVPLNVQAGNTVAVSVGDAPDGMAVVYQGTISQATAEYGAMPQVPFHVSGLAALDAAMMTATPTSYSGAADAVSIMANLAQQMGLSFQNSGVSGSILHSPYFYGSPYAQAEACAHQAGINMTVMNGSLYIWPIGGSITGSTPIISPASGLIGYPIKTAIGVDFNCLYNPGIGFGSNIQLQSSIKQACGVWSVKGLEHTLEANTPGGSWSSRVSCVPVGFI